MKSEVIVLDPGIFLRECSSRRKIPRSKQSPINSHNDRNIDGAKLLLSLIIAIVDILMHFRCNFMKKYFINLFLHSLSIYPCERISICPGMTIIA